MSNKYRFRKSLKVAPTDNNTNQLSTEENFNKIYDEFLKYLQGIEFLDYLDNYKKTKENDTIQGSFTDEQFLKIFYYVELISKKPEYIQYLNEKEIPNRSNDETDYSSLTDEEKEKKQIEFQKKLSKEEKNIRIQYYIKDIVQNHLIYNNESMRKFFTYSSALTLMQFCETDSSKMNTPTIHFRFKSPYGLFLKSAFNIFIHNSPKIKGSYFVRNPNGKDSFKYRKVNDAYAYKLIGSIGNTPQFVKDPDTDPFYDNRNLLYTFASEFLNFNTKLQQLISDTLPEGSSISYDEYFQNCLKVLRIQKDITNKKAVKIIENIDKQIANIEELINSYSETHSLNDSMDSSYFDNISNDITKIDFSTLLENFLSQIPCRLTTKIFEKALNAFFNQSNNDFKSRQFQNLFIKFELELGESEDKCTSSGHQAHHYDLITNFFGAETGCECQCQDITNYIIDQYGEFSAHALMPGKQIDLLTLPAEYSASQIQNPNDFFCIGEKYYNKQEVYNYIKRIEMITAKKGKISYNKALGIITITFYPTLHNYKSLATELPSTSLQYAKAQRHFFELEKKSDDFKNMLFGSAIPGYEVTFEIINSFISALRNTDLHKRTSSSTQAPSQISSLDEIDNR